jgi:cobalt-zinc-cadmium efflux system membrane fusion protein
VRQAAVALAALLIAAAAPADKGDKGTKPQDPPGVVRMTQEQQGTIKLQTARADRRPITEPVHVPGTVAFDQGHVALLRPLAQARVVRLLAQPGDAVRAGQPLAELDIPSLVNAEEGLAAAEASVREAEAGVAVARDSLRRGEILARDGSLARAEAERRRLVLAQAVAALDAARARVTALRAEVARLDPGKTPGVATLASPIAGVVVSVGVTPGEFVDSAGGSNGGSAFTVADLSVVLVLAQVPEASAPLVAVGDPAQVRLTSGGDRVWTGRVIALGAELDPQARTLSARVQIANVDGALRAGMLVDVTLTSDRGRDDVVVPAGAVQTVGGKRVAFTPLGGDRFQSHDLTIGVERQDWIEVRSGLSAGDTVVTQGSFELKALLQKAMAGGAG